MKYSIIIPAYNEEKRIGVTLDDYCSYFSKFPKGEVEIIVVLNGCVDNTLMVVKEYAKKYAVLRYVDIKEAIRKGGAVIEGFKIAKGDLIGYADADGATRAQYYYDLVKNINNADGVIASRWMEGAIVEPKQPLIRRIASRAFNLMTKILFGLDYFDTQCGCKLFRKEAIGRVISSLRTTGWAFDVDLLYQMKRFGLKIKEVPTVWRDRTGSSINVRKVSIEMFLAIARLRLVYSPFRFVVDFYNKIAYGFGIKF